MIRNHWGLYVDSDTPVNGHIYANELSSEVLCSEDEILPEYDDPELCQYHEGDCPVFVEDDIYADCTCGYWDVFDTSYSLIGAWILDTTTGKYDCDKNGEYSAIYGYNDNSVAVVHSEYVNRCNLGSPCIPGQCYLSSRGEFLAYDLPPEFWGDRPREWYTSQRDCIVAGVELKRGDTIALHGSAEHDRYGRIWHTSLELWRDDARTSIVIGPNPAYAIRAMLRAMGIESSYFDAPTYYVVSDSDRPATIAVSEYTFLEGHIVEFSPEDLRLSSGDTIYTVENDNDRYMLIRRGDTGYRRKMQEGDTIGAVLNYAHIL